MDSEKRVIQYLKDEITMEEFLKDLPELYDYLEEKYQYCAENKLIRTAPKGSYNYELYYKDFKTRIKPMIENTSFPFKNVAIYERVYEIMNKSGAFTEPCSEGYNIVYEFYTFTWQYIPDCFLSDEAGKFIYDNIYLKMPEFKTQSAKKAWIKSECEKLFHVEGRNRPYWVQESEWPVRNGLPCKYIGRKKNGDQVIYEFLDTTNNEKVFVEQYY